jgi:Zn-dependent protease
MKPLFRFHIGSIPVDVHPWFFLTAAMLGAAPGVKVVGLVLWVAVVFVGVLLHELGHAIAGKAFGLEPMIDLLAFGGLTSWRGGGRRAISTARQIAISVAGPFVGIAIGALALLYMKVRADEPMSPTQAQLVADVMWVNLAWGILNLLPILPLDGGNVLFAVAQRVTNGHGERPARMISLATALLVALYALSRGSMVNAMFAGLFALQNFQALRAARSD